jgi:hypothetical protein
MAFRRVVFFNFLLLLFGLGDGSSVESSDVLSCSSTFSFSSWNFSHFVFASDVPFAHYLQRISYLLVHGKHKTWPSQGDLLTFLFLYGLLPSLLKRRRAGCIGVRVGVGFRVGV